KVLQRLALDQFLVSQPNQTPTTNAFFYFQARQTVEEIEMEQLQTLVNSYGSRNIYVLQKDGTTFLPYNFRSVLPLYNKGFRHQVDQKLRFQQKTSLARI